MNEMIQLGMKEQEFRFETTGALSGVNKAYGRSVSQTIDR